MEHDLNFVLPQKKYENQFFEDSPSHKKLVVQPFKVIIFYPLFFEYFT
jgi:hypothetical protein